MQKLFVRSICASLALVGTSLDCSAATRDVASVSELLEAVRAAAAGDTIRLTPGTYVMTGQYMKTETVAASSPITVQHHIYSQKKLHFEGMAASGTVGHWGGEVVLKGDGRFFRGDSAEANKSTFRHLTFEDFVASDRLDLSPTSGGNLNTLVNGGAISMSGAQLDGLATNCVFRNCRARNGGALMNLNACDCLFDGNYAKNQGGAALNGRASDCTYRKNHADGGCGAYWWPSSLDRCVFEENYSGTGPGAVNTATGKTISECRFVRNRATTAGGAVALRQRSVLVDCHFEGNEAGTDGGAVYAGTRTNDTDNDNGGRDGTIQGCVFIDNVARQRGGAICAYEGKFDNVWEASVSIVDCAFTNNCSRPVNANESTTEASLGGAVHGGTVSNCMFVGNHAIGKGGAVNLHSPMGAVWDSTFIGNVTRAAWANATESSGGAAIAAQAGGVVRDCVFLRNVSTNATTVPKSGSIVLGARGNRLAVENCAFTNNYTFWGGIVTHGTCSNVVFYGNETLQGGGVVYHAAAVDCQFVGNRKFDTLVGYDTAATYNGAAFANIPGGDANDAELLRCDLDGGVIYHSVLTDCHIHDVTNKGAYCVFYGYNVATNCLISQVGDRARSTTKTDFRGVCYRWGNATTGAESWSGHSAESAFVNCTFADTSVVSGYNGGKQFYLDTIPRTHPCRFLNCLFYNNVYGGAVGDLVVNSAASGASGVSFSHCVFGVAPRASSTGTLADLGDNAIIAPDKLGILTGDAAQAKGVPAYTLAYGSPARGKADATFWSASATDRAGNLRVREGAVDPGCYECWIIPNGTMLLFR